jgi:hypothetical protein
MIAALIQSRGMRVYLASTALVALVGSAALITGIARAVEAEITIGNEDLPANLGSIPTTHRQLKSISLDSKMRLADFCLSPDGKILALANGEAQHGLIVDAINAISGKAGEPSGKKSELHVYDRDGNLEKKWTIDFQAQAINAGADGSIIVGGEGQLAHYDAQGSLIAQAVTSQAEAIRKNPDLLREQAEESLEAERASVDEQLKTFDEQKKQIEAKEKSNLTEEEKQYLAIYDAQVNAYKQWGDQLKKKTVEQAMAEISERVMRINAIAVSDKEVFVACPMTKSYGYAVWRTDKDFKQPVQIISGLSGCCGQMDIQCTGDKLYVAENSRHRVVCYNRDGKELSNFGKRDRDSIECFGGCCNPMNLCFAKSGDLYVSESNGLVKQFTSSGEYKGLVGVAKVPAGCKNSAVATTVDGDRVYYIDINNSKIIVLARNDETANASK